MALPPLRSLSDSLPPIPRATTNRQTGGECVWTLTGAEILRSIAVVALTVTSSSRSGENSNWTGQCHVGKLNETFGKVKQHLKKQNAKHPKRWNKVFQFSQGSPTFTKLVRLFRRWFHFSEGHFTFLKVVSILRRWIHFPKIVPLFSRAFHFFLRC